MFPYVLLVLSKPPLYPNARIPVETTTAFHWCWPYCKHFGNSCSEIVFVCDEALLKGKYYGKCVDDFIEPVKKRPVLCFPLYTVMGKQRGKKVRKILKGLGDSLNQWSSKCGPWLAASASPGNFEKSKLSTPLQTYLLRISKCPHGF